MKRRKFKPLEENVQDDMYYTRGEKKQLLKAKPQIMKMKWVNLNLTNLFLVK